MPLPVILDRPVHDGRRVTGVCEGRIVAYWPTAADEAGGMRAVGHGGYIPAMITASWSEPWEDGKPVPAPVPAVNLTLIPDRCNVANTLVGRGSVPYSDEPARGSWTWIPKA